MNTRVPAEVFPPGDYIREELEERGWNQVEFAEILGVSASTVSDLILGKRTVTPDNAKALEAALGPPAEYWLNLDAYFRLWSDPAPIPAHVRRRARIRERFPVRHMVNRGWVEPSTNPEVLEARLLEWFGVSSLGEQPQLPHAARKGATLDGYDSTSPEQLAWLFRVKQLAEAQHVPLYAASRLRAALRELRNLMIAPEEIRHVPGILAESGVRFVVVEFLPSSKIDGVCFWLNENQPVIGMSLRLDRIDNFWFVLRHEIEHVLNGDASIDTDLATDDDTVSEQERKANAAAGSFGVAAKTMDDFVTAKSSLFSKSRIENFARMVGVHPGIVVGQLQRRLGRWDLQRPLLVKIRDHIVPSALTDGYGEVADV